MATVLDLLEEDMSRILSYLGSTKYEDDVNRVANKLEKYALSSLENETSTPSTRKVLVPVNLEAEREVPFYLTLKTFDGKAEFIRVFSGDLSAALTNLGYETSVQVRVSADVQSADYYTTLIIEIPQGALIQPPAPPSIGGAF